MTGSHLFTLGLFQKNFNSTSRVTGPAINMGCTRGRGSTTRILNYYTQHSQRPSLCINQFLLTNSYHNLQNNHVIPIQKKNIEFIIEPIIEPIIEQIIEPIIEPINDDNYLPELFEIYFMRKTNSEEWFDNNDL